MKLPLEGGRLCGAVRYRISGIRLDGVRVAAELIEKAMQVNRSGCVPAPIDDPEH